jgi:hypothetical protein
VGLKGDERVWRAIGSGEYGVLLLRDDLKEPLKELELEKGESVRWIPVDSRSFVPSLVTPGDQVSFIIPKPRGVPTRAPERPAAEPKSREPAADAKIPNPTADSKIPNPVSAAAPAKPEEENAAEFSGSEIEETGLFTVVSVGNRLGDLKVMQAAKIPQLQETVLGIRVGPKNSKEWLDANDLWNRLQAVDFRHVGIALHSKK